MRKTEIMFVVDALDDGKVRLRVTNGEEVIDTYHLPLEVAGTLARQLTMAVDESMKTRAAALPVIVIHSAMGNH